MKCPNGHKFNAPQLLIAEWIPTSTGNLTGAGGSCNYYASGMDTTTATSSPKIYVVKMFCPQCNAEITPG